MSFKPIDAKAATEADFVARMVLESIKLLDSYNDELKFKFLLGVVNHIAFTSLTQSPDAPCSREEMVEFTQRNFAVAKINVQNMVAGAFNQAMLLFSGKDMHYGCIIKPSKEDGAKPLLN